MAKTNLNEDKIALLTGCFIFLLAALNLAHLDVLGWVVSTNMWTSMDKAFSATTGAYKGTISGVVSLLCTYVALTAILSFGIKLLGGNVARFVKSFTVVFFISEICYMFGANAHIAATPDAQAKFGIDWSIGLTTEAGFIVALVAGIFISNAFPRIAESLHDACRPELFVKIAIVVLGAELGVKAAAASGMAGTIIFRGLCAIVEAYLLYWAFVYYVARKYFKFSREWAVPLASGISITVVYIPQYFRTIRAEVIRIKESAYVESARVVGASTWRIMTKHLLKNSTRTLPVILTLNSSEAILTLAGLGFLGFGIEPTAAAEWGYDLNRSVSDVTAGIWWTAVFPGIAIVLIVLGITLVGESLNDLADPRLRARKSAGEVVGSIEDTSVDPSQKPGVRNEVIAELAAAKNPMGASDQPVTVTDRDPSFTASEWGSKEEE